MAKAHCENHKRYVPTCIGCQSEALKETVGFPKQPEGEVKGESQEESGETTEGAPGPDAEEEEEEGGDIAEWEPEVEEDPNIPDPWADGKTPAEGDDTGNWKPPAEREPVPLPSYVPAGAVLPPVAGDEPDIDKTEAAMAAEGEFDPEPVVKVEIDGEGNVVPLVPGEAGQSGAEQGPTQMEPIDVAMALFPRRLIPEGATEVCDEERPDEPYMASYEELIRRAVEGYINAGLEPEDAAIVVASEVIQAEKMAPDFGEGVEEETEEAFEAGLEAAPEITGCIEDYNQGFNEGMDTLLDTLVGYYGGDTDAPAFSMLEWLRVQMAGMKK